LEDMRKTIQQNDDTKQLERDLTNAIKARYPLIWLKTTEERRVLEIITNVVAKRNRKAYVYDIVRLWTSISEWTTSTTQRQEFNKDLRGESLEEALDSVLENRDSESIFIFPDFHVINTYQSPIVFVRRLKYMSERLRAGRASVIFISHSLELPQELRDIVHTMEVKPPGLRELIGEITRVASEVEVSDSEMDATARAALGLSLNQASRLFSMAIIASPKDPSKWVPIVTQGKRDIVRGSGAMEFFSPQECPTDLGGLKILKEWLERRKQAFTKEAEEYGLPFPRGVALIGIPGTGKSLAAKFIAGSWSLPLLRLDLGAVFGGLIGQSEENIRRALQMAEAIAPCVLWIDEIEKGVQTEGLDAGTSARVFASLLTWMQEKLRPVFVVATANDVEKIPPELLRKGRFDEVFFLDLPIEKERIEIFEVHLRRVRRDPEKFDIKKLVRASEKFVGAEIEQVVREALYKAFNEGKREPTTEDILDALKRTVPLSEAKKEVIERLQLWLKNRQAISASEEEPKEVEMIGIPRLEKD